MSAKREVRELLARLPDDVELDEVVYHLYVYRKLQRACRDIEEGKLIPHEDIVEELRQRWLRRTG